MVIGEADRSLLELLARRLERLSVDSRWAHRASGMRGQLLRVLERLEAGEPVERGQAEALLEAGFFILRQAAREIRYQDWSE